MKKLAILLFIIFGVQAMAQKNIPIVYLNENVSTHFISDYELEYMDISTNEVVGDFPMKNILRLKPKAAGNKELGVVTIVTETEYKQYKMVYVTDSDKADKTVNLSGGNSMSYINLEETLNSLAIKGLASQMMDEKVELNAVVSKKYRQKLRLNNIWVVKDYIFLDYTLSNDTDIPYTVDEIRYKIVDKKVKRRRSSQDLELEPEYSHIKHKMFKGDYRNIVAFKKFTFPNAKSLTINVAENQISGREITLDIAYSDLLNAKIFKG